jgi:hypothetical protein
MMHETSHGRDVRDVAGSDDVVRPIALNWPLILSDE